MIFIYAIITTLILSGMLKFYQAYKEHKKHLFFLNELLKSNEIFVIKILDVEYSADYDAEFPNYIAVPSLDYHVIAMSLARVIEHPIYISNVEWKELI